jgi:pimeloyl-ACP methyl ester carboxylesterase
VLDRVDGPFLYAGDSVGGQVGLQLLLDAPDRVLGAVLCCTGPKIGAEAGWRERVAQVRASGTASLVTASAERWFAPGFVEEWWDTRVAEGAIVPVDGGWRFSAAAEQALLDELKAVPGHAAV